MTSRSLSIAQSFVLAVACVGLGACRGVSGLAPADDAAIRKVVDEFSRTCYGGKADAAACARLYYSSDATLVLPGAPDIKGQEAIEQFLAFFRGIRESKIEIRRLGGQGDVAYVYGTVAYVYGTNTLTREPAGGAPAVKEEWRYVEVWRRQPDGAWKVVYDIGNQETPPGLLVATARPRPDASPELQKIASWVGRWKQEGTYHETPVSPAGPVTWDLDCQWIVGGHQVGCSAIGTGASVGYGEVYLIGYDPAAKAYTLFDADSNGFAGDCRGDFQDSTWRFHLETRVQGKPARLAFTVAEESPDVKAMKGDISIAGAPATLVYEGRLSRTR